MAIILTNKKMRLINNDNTVLTKNTYSQDDASREELSSCHVVRQVVPPVYRQAAVFASCQGDELTAIETHRNVDEH